jgi:choline transport protein
MESLWTKTRESIPDLRMDDATGLSADELQLRAQDHKQEMPRKFSGFATLALAFSMTNSWIGYSATFPYPLLAGGGPTVFFGLIVASVACSFISTFSLHL